MKVKRYFIVNPRRFFAFLTFIFMLISILIIIFINSSKAHSSIYQTKFKEYHIVNGDNLWNISARNIPEGYDIRKMIYEIKELNQMDTSYIYPGEIIKIPIYDHTNK